MYVYKYTRIKNTHELLCVSILFSDILHAGLVYQVSYHSSPTLISRHESKKILALNKPVCKIC